MVTSEWVLKKFFGTALLKLDFVGSDLQSRGEHTHFMTAFTVEVLSMSGRIYVLQV